MSNLLKKSGNHPSHNNHKNIPVIQILRLEDTSFWPLSWGIVAMKSLGPGKVAHAFNPRRLGQADFWVQGQSGTKQVPDLGMVVLLIWATPSAGGLHKDSGRRKTCFSSTSVGTYLLRTPAYTEGQLKQPATWDWSTIDFGFPIHSCSLLN